MPGVKALSAVVANVYLLGVASLELLNAINTRGVNTTADVAGALGIDESETAREIGEAEAAGLVADAERGRVRLTAAGHVTRTTLEDARADRPDHLYDD